MIIQGNAKEVLKGIKSESVNCCITSPPYWGLRDYGTATWEGGNPECPHQIESQGRTEHREGRTFTKPKIFPDICPLCGAKRVDAQIGLEKTPEEFIKSMVEIFREVHRILKPDGTLWLNIADTYAQSSYGKGGGWAAGKHYDGEKKPSQERSLFEDPGFKADVPNKNLVGIPWRVALALQADGWILRQDIIWHKTNPMPESIRDRCTKSHEYVFLMAKSEKYYFDSEGIREAATYPKGPGNIKPYEVPGQRPGVNANVGNSLHKIGPRDTRNKRSVWTVPVKGFKGAHFATFPTALISPMIVAGCPRGGTVFDPFTGAGTTWLVAKELGRNFLGCELNPEYIKIATARVEGC